jgi:hypothetical protein
VRHDHTSSNCITALAVEKYPQGGIPQNHHQALCREVFNITQFTHVNKPPQFEVKITRQGSNTLKILLTSLTRNGNKVDKKRE